MEALLGIGQAFGLSSSAGLNAYIPMLLMAVLARFNVIQLEEPYSVIGSVWVIAVLSVLLLIEIFVDKIPGADTVNDMIGTFVRPAAGALMFAANADVITEINPIFAVILGILVAGGVHATKTTVRPVVTASTVGFGNPVVSTLEDVTAFSVSILSIFVPIIITVVLLVLFVWLFWRYRQRQNDQKLTFK